MILRPIAPYPSQKFLLFLFGFFFIILHYGSALANSVTLAWDANREAKLVAYRLYYSVDASNQTMCHQGESPVTIPVALLANPDIPTFELTGLAAGYTYFFNVTAVNDLDLESDFSNMISFAVDSNAGPMENKAFQFETGETWVDHNWKRVDFEKTYVNPVVVSSSISLNDAAPAVIRIDNVTDKGFDICLQEWDYLDDQHAFEQVGYLVMESGSYILPDGTLAKAGTFETNAIGSFNTVNFNGTFNTIPVVIAVPTTFNEPDAVTVRLSGICTQGFSMIFQEQEANTKEHNSETVSYIAWEPSRGSLSGIDFEVGATPAEVKNEDYRLFFTRSFVGSPGIVSSIQTYYGGNTSSVRWKNKTGSSLYLKVAEEQSFDEETYHISESVGYILFQNDKDM